MLGAGYAYRTKARHSGRLADYAAYLADDTHTPDTGQVKVTYLGTTTHLVEHGTTRVLVDAYLTRVTLADFALHRRVSTSPRTVATLLNRAGVDQLDAIFVSHSHFDHALDLACIAERTGALVHGSESTLNVARGGDVPEQRLHAFDLTQPVGFGDISVRVLRSRHSPRVLGGEGTPIGAPLPQPAAVWDYKEGGTYDFLVTAGNVRMLFKNSANWIPGVLDGITVDVLFLGIAGLGNADPAFAQGFLDATVGTVRPALVVPTHWNDFFCRVTPDLRLQRGLIDHIPAAFDRLRRRLDDEHIEFAILDAFSSLVLPRDTRRNPRHGI